ncbi:hypothetical protein E2562_002741 [Oryza meyeriana var. granulata]|uniref:Uncharacterized protein n=1 Tax=Oryza meyeriana var. granulata TaxID=110450 RepID=A0A6G1BRG2_9ORYZ|nr:hypothetical protein E2562_002741 [Oryza meyeriana var. granulata]
MALLVSHVNDDSGAAPGSSTADVDQPSVIQGSPDLMGAYRRRTDQRKSSRATVRPATELGTVAPSIMRGRLGRGRADPQPARPWRGGSMIGEEQGLTDDLRPNLRSHGP